MCNGVLKGFSMDINGNGGMRMHPSRSNERRVWEFVNVCEEPIAC